MRDTPMNPHEDIRWSDVTAVLVAGIGWMQFEKIEDAVIPAEGIVGNTLAFLVCASILFMSICAVWTIRTLSGYVLRAWRGWY